MASRTPCRVGRELDQNQSVRKGRTGGPSGCFHSEHGSSSAPTAMSRICPQEPNKRPSGRFSSRTWEFCPRRPPIGRLRPCESYLPPVRTEAPPARLSGLGIFPVEMGRNRNNHGFRDVSPVRTRTGPLEPELNTGRSNCDRIVMESGFVFTYTGGVFSLYQLRLNTLFHRLRYWKIKVL